MLAFGVEDTHDERDSIAEEIWKVRPQRVTVPYAKSKPIRVDPE